MRPLKVKQCRQNSIKVKEKQQEQKKQINKLGLGQKYTELTLFLSSWNLTSCGAATPSLIGQIKKALGEDYVGIGSVADTGNHPTICMFCFPFKQRCSLS